MNELGLYIPGNSRLHLADPRIKLLMVLVGTVVLFVYANVFTLLLALLLLQVTLLLSGISRQRITQIWALIAPVAVLIPLLWPLFNQAGPVWCSFWLIRITGFAVAQGVAAAARIASLAFLFSALLLTTDMRALLRSFVVIGLPYNAAITLTIALSYVPRIQRTYQTVTEAQMARGLELARGSFAQKARSRVPVLVAALVSTFRSADTLARALECRGFGRQGVRRTSLYELHWRRDDTFAVIAISLVFFLLLYLRLAQSIGVHPFYL